MRFATRFETLIAPLQHPLLSIAINLLSLLARLRSQPTRRHTGTPLQRSLPFLAPLFLRCIFGLGPAALPLNITYLEYLRATNAMEHVLLAFVRWQDTPSNGSSGSFGSWQRCISRCTHPPQRLDSWLPGDTPITSHSIEETRGASTPSHTPDLVKSAASWAPTRALSGVAHAPNTFANLGIGTEWPCRCSS
jgi:hypothetical protein